MSMLANGSVNVGADKKSIVLSFRNEGNGAFAYDQFKKDKPREELKELIGELTGKEVEITCQLKDSLEEKDLGTLNLSKMNFGVRFED